MGDKGFLPVFGMKPRLRAGGRVVRWRCGPCLVMIAAVFIFATICIDLFGWNAPPSSPSPRKSSGKPPAFDGWDKLDRFFIFGESYSETGFDVDGTPPAEGNPLGNPEFVEGTGIPKLGPMGPIWVHYATTVYNSSVVKTYDLAKGGSTVDRDVVNPVFPTAGTFGDQIVNAFVPHYGLNSPDADWQASTSLFAVFFGVTDLIITFHDEKRAPVEEIIESYFGSLQYLYEVGARNFLLFNLPPMDRPYQANKKGVKELRKDVVDFNARLRKTKRQFESRHRNANVFLFDTAQFFNDVMANPRKFPQTSKITYTKGPCPLYDLGIGASGDIDIDRVHQKCGVPVSQYFWHDFIHITYPTHDALAATMVEDCMGPTRKRYCS